MKALANHEARCLHSKIYGRQFPMSPHFSGSFHTAQEWLKTLEKRSEKLMIHWNNIHILKIDSSLLVLNKMQLLLEINMPCLLTLHSGSLFNTRERLKSFSYNFVNKL